MLGKTRGTRPNARAVAGAFVMRALLCSVCSYGGCGHMGACVEAEREAAGLGGVYIGAP